MAAQKAEKKTRSKRKARTEVSSSSSSDSDSGSESSNPTSKPQNKSTTAARAPESSDSHADDSSVASEPVFTRKHINPDQAFEEFYLRQATKELANDLDKLRSASDFKASSVPMLIDALKQGTVCFSQEERVKVGSAAEAKGGE
ncbi:hypothetical protein KC332_g12369 [Hortaea werneckii]|uniref:Ribosome assembly protein 3 n=2 Tax=Hortaea werneckii TaxID=91943 RepID=A0A3M7IEW2_HORWE|nr:hypothetical protein KC358_g12266 [Hortaea werneckii]OTA39858.1 hypothetical protein BTJ68_00083 [Hortaea werneckii EXF-2000]KAI6815088.1 hypothetical protein KC350_g11097 [Hortaea werneckii]KAI6915665.1 hypothetical protein KC348_g11915 [Hortaea werneckii]KAI6928681.1 hypothetical protein KC341_g11355 [Hortaea werneckii]